MLHISPPEGFLQKRKDLIFVCRLQNAFEYVGGVPQIILFDNAKTVVSERIGPVIQFNRNLMRFALQYGFKLDACWIYDPESKGKVENSIRYVNRDFFYARPVTDLETLNNEYLGWCDEVAREVPADRLGEEKQALLPVPSNGCAVFSQVTRNVAKNCMFSFETNEYSVPREYARKKVTINVYPERLKVYAGNKRIAVHEGCFERGQIVIGDGHFDDRPYAERSNRWVLLHQDI